jgi:23S rRNA (adenine2030-N6)-methyltransferase
VNYRHIFHAGNFADVFKHALLLELVAALTAKPKPICYLETHAGAGLYVLAGTEAEKTGEFRQGVLRVMEAQPASEALAAYLDLIRACNLQVTKGQVARYPGSPWFAASSLRAGDRMVLCELQEAEFYGLSAVFENDARVRVYRRDGYAALKALLPPKERRGLVLIDPPFEGQEGEFRLIEAALGRRCGASRPAYSSCGIRSSCGSRCGRSIGGWPGAAPRACWPSSCCCTRTIRPCASTAAAWRS